MKDPELLAARKADLFIAQQTRTALAYVRDRRRHFQMTSITLSKHALKMSRYASMATVSIIVLGAFVGTKAVTDNLLGAANPLNVLAYALAGVLIAVLSGLESTFKWSSKAAELRQIAARCRRSEHAIDMDLRTIHSDDLEAATALLKRVDTTLDEIEGDVLKIGGNLQLSISAELYPALKKSPAEQQIGKKSRELLNSTRDTANQLETL
ncbi:MAG TPA: hypothetical protein VGD98_19830 [Ktedonobacteraceae bacterium]